MNIPELRPWGGFSIIYMTRGMWVKLISIKPGCRTSLQSHKLRSEYWICTSGSLTAIVGKKKIAMTKGDFVHVPIGRRHRIESTSGGVLLELALGEPREDDIVRYEDDYGRAI